MKKVLFLIALLAICFSVPASALAPSGFIPSGWYSSEWSNDFETYACVTAPKDIAGQDGWVKTATAANSGKILHSSANALSGDHYFQQVASTKSQATRDMRASTAAGVSFKYGTITAWVWDPKLPSTSTTDTRVGVASSVTAIGDNIGKIVSMNITSGAGLTGDYNYWRGQWSYSAFSLDGVTTPAAGTGYSFTVGIPAPRVAGWSFAMMNWNYTFSEETPGHPAMPKSVQFKWYINPDLDEDGNPGENYAPNMILDVNSTSSRWTNSRDAVGMIMGSYNVSSTNQGRIDNVYFGGEVVPEPSSLMALGTGLIGLVGLIRRKR